MAATTQEQGEAMGDGDGDGDGGGDGDGDGDGDTPGDGSVREATGTVSAESAAGRRGHFGWKISICIGTNHDILSQPARTPASPPISRPDHPLRCPRPRHPLARVVAFQMTLRTSVAA